MLCVTPSNERCATGHSLVLIDQRAGCDSINATRLIIVILKSHHGASVLTGGYRCDDIPENEGKL